MTDILDDIDDAARELLKAVKGNTIGEAGSSPEPQPVDLKDRIAAFTAVTNYLAVKQKLKPQGAGANGIDRYRATINGGAPGRRTRRQSGTAPNSAPHAEPGED